MSQSDKEDKESVARSQLPFKAEYCKTSRAKCKKCQQPMLAKTLKIASMVKSRWHDGYDATFYHVACFFQLKRPTSVAEIGHFETLKFDDQKMLEGAIESEGLSVLGKLIEDEAAKSTSKTSKKETNPKKRNKDDSDRDDGAEGVLCNYDDYLVGYAKSNRSKCNKCDGKIDKNSVRLAKLDHENEGQFNGPTPRWYHVDCFAKSLTKIKFFGKIEKLKDFDQLAEEDQKMLKEKVKEINIKDFVAEIENKKLKAEKSESQEHREEAAKEKKLLKIQSDKFFALREEVDKIKRKDLEDILTHMRQKSYYKNPSLLVDAVTDSLMFGPIGKCPQCKKRGGFVLKAGEYICTSGGEIEPCTYETREPKREMPDIPNEIVEKYPYFEKKYKFKAGSRLFGSDFIKAVEQKEAEINKIAQKGVPLEGVNIGVIAWKGLDMDKTTIQNKVTILGAHLLTSIDSSLFVILSSKNQFEKDEPKVMVAKELNVPFATPEFLFEIKTRDDVIPQLKKCLIGKWPGDLEARFADKLEIDDIKIEQSS